MMSNQMDEIDRRILRALQEDASRSMDDLADHVGLSRNACWRRMHLLQDAGVIGRKVALVDPDVVGLPLLVMVRIRTNQHDAAWSQKFRQAARAFDEVVSAYRVSGELDYMLHVRVADVAAYDRFYQRLVERIDLADVSASFVMESIKDTTALPL